MPRGDKQALMSYQVPLPDKETQKKISTIFSNLDQKIELNNKIIANLEELSQTLFQRWFIDFEFRNEDGESYRSSGGKLVESALGLIPEEWKISSLDEVSKQPIVCGKTPSTKVKENYGDRMPFITIPDMHNTVFIDKTERYLSDIGIDSQAKKTLPPLSVCISCIATPGLVILTSEESQTNQQINSVIPREIDAYYIYLYLSRKSREIQELGSGGSTTLNLNKTQFSKINIIYPNEKIRNDFNRTICPIFDMILSLQKQNSELINLREQLLPKLLSGEIEIDEESEVEVNGTFQ